MPMTMNKQYTRKLLFGSLATQVTLCPLNIDDLMTLLSKIRSGKGILYCNCNDYEDEDE